MKYGRKICDLRQILKKKRVAKLSKYNGKEVNVLEQIKACWNIPNNSNDFEWILKMKGREHH